MRRALALRMGYPMRMLSRLMLYVEFRQWVEAFAEQPFDDAALLYAHSVHTARLQATFHNSQLRGPNARDYMLQPADFLPKPVFKARPILTVGDDEVVVFDDQVMRLQ